MNAISPTISEQKIIHQVVNIIFFLELFGIFISMIFKQTMFIKPWNCFDLAPLVIWVVNCNLEIVLSWPYLLTNEPKKLKFVRHIIYEFYNLQCIQLFAMFVIPTEIFSSYMIIDKTWMNWQ